MDTTQSAPPVTSMPNSTERAVSVERVDTGHTVVEHAPVEAPAPAPATAPKKRRTTQLVAAIVVAIIAGWVLVPWVILSLNTVSTDDAYVDGHVTFLAPRVAGQVSRVLVDDNMRVKKGDLLVAIDPEPFQVQVDMKKALVRVAETDLAAAHATVLGDVGLARSARYNLEHAIETVNNQIATLKANVAQLNVEKAGLVLAERDYDRNKPLLEKNALSQQEFDLYIAKRDQARSRVDSAEQVVQETRTGLGLPTNIANPLDLPKDLDQNFSLVRQSLATLMQSAAKIGFVPKSWNYTPKEAIAEFYKLDKEHNIDTIYARLIPDAPLIKQAEAKLLQAKTDLELAELDLRYCNIVSEIDGVVTRRNVNPGNFIQVGQSLMAVRSLTEIWVNANFKETQLGELRIGQRVELEVDMYGGRHEFEGRITGFTMGTGQTLALLPPQNATGNFIKIVQRLPVRIELTKYDAEKSPLFVGLSVEPRVFIKEKAEGPNAGQVLQPGQTLPQPSMIPPPIPLPTAMPTGTP